MKRQRFQKRINEAFYKCLYVYGLELAPNGGFFCDQDGDDEDKPFRDFDRAVGLFLRAVEQAGLRSVDKFKLVEVLNGEPCYAFTDPSLSASGIMPGSVLVANRSKVDKLPDDWQIPEPKSRRKAKAVK